MLYVGAVHSGKTSRLGELVGRLRSNGRTVAGILAPSLWHNGKLLGFDVVDLVTGERRPLATRSSHKGSTLGGFVFDPKGLSFGRSALAGEQTLSSDLVIVDEFGPLELDGGGFRHAVDQLARDATGTVLLVVRDELSERVGALYSLDDDRIIRSDGSTRRLIERLFGDAGDGDGRDLGR